MLLKHFLTCLSGALFSLSLFAQEAATDTPSDFTKEPEREWTFSTGKPIYASPVIHNNLVYIGSCDSNMYALDVNKGNVQWKLKTNGEIRSTASIYRDMLFFLSGDGFCYCVNKSTGAVIWKFATQGERQYELYSFADYTQSSPVYRNGVIYFGSGDGNVYALHAVNGTLAWKYATGSVVHAVPAIEGDQLYIGSFDGSFYALHAGTGKLLWKFKSVGQKYFPKGEMQGTPLVVGDVVVVGSRDYNLYAINKLGGYCEWNRKFPRGWAMGTPALKDSFLFIGTSDDYEMHAIDPSTGLSKWKTNVKFNIFGSSAFSKSMLYFGTLMGRLFALDQKTGNITWSFQTDSYDANKTVYFTSEDVFKEGIFGTVIKKNEDFLEMYIKLGGIFSTPAITTSSIIISSLDGKVYALKRQQ